MDLEVWAKRVDLAVIVYQRPHMRDEMLEMELGMSRRLLVDLFDNETNTELLKVEEAHFSFPERWLNIVEERSLFARLDRWCPNLKKVTLKTQSPHIIQCTPNGHCFVVQVETPLPQEAVSGRLWRPMTGNFFGDGLSFMGGTVHGK